MMTFFDDPKAERLDTLYTLLRRYADSWGESPSKRMIKWVDEYNDYRFSPYWDDHCSRHEASPTHDAYDLFA